MAMSDEQARRAAAEFMRQKGYEVGPSLIEKVEGLDVWYFYYDLAEGTLELEVEWDGSQWLWSILDFTHRDDGETLVGCGR